MMKMKSVNSTVMPLVLSVMFVSALNFEGNTTAASASETTVPNYSHLKMEVVEEVPTASDLKLAAKIAKTNTSLTQGTGGTLDGAGLILDKIINIGTKIWNILEKGKPVMKLDSTSASALPKGAEGWDQLGGWSKPVARAFKFTFGGAVAFRYLIVYSYGGNVSGKGKYLSEVAVVPAGATHLSMTYNLDVQAKVRSVTNEGTSADPVAAMQLMVSFGVTNPFMNFPNYKLYYINGLGEFAELTNGTL